MPAIRFPPFRLDLTAGQLWHGETRVPLRPKTFATLCFLAQRPGALVSKDDLLDAVWRDVVVNDDTPRFSVRELRRALGDDPAAPRFIETVHGRGYRFVATVVGVGDAPQPDAPSADDAIVVGRDAELATLDTWLASARTGERVVGFLAGDSGIGKTTLVERFVPRAAAGTPGLVVMRGECRQDVGPGEPYRPLLEGVQGLAASHRDRLLSTLRAHAPTWLAQLPSLSGAADDARAIGSSGERMVREFASWIEAMTADAPVLLVIEDLHWSDRATLDVLAATAHGRSPARVLVLATYRPVDAIVSDHPLRAVRHDLSRKRLARELRIAALSRDAVHRYLAVRFGEDVAQAALVDFVHHRSDGNPLFMGAVADQLVGSGVVVRDGGAWRADPKPALADLGIPDTLREMVERQLETLDAPTRAALDAGAVAGIEFAAPTVAATLDGGSVEHVEDCCDVLVRQERFVRVLGAIEWPDGTAGACYAFRHGLYRDVLYDRIPPSRRQRLHQMIGERLERAYGANAAAVCADLGMHFERSRDRPRAIQYFAQAAAVAQRRFADREAIAFLERALALVDALPTSDDRTQQELMLRMLLAPSLSVAEGFFSPALERSSVRVRALLQDLGDTPSHFFALLALFAFELMRGHLEQATAIADRASALGPRVAPAFAPVGRLSAGISHCYRGEFALARTHLDAVLAAAPDEWPSSSDTRLVALFHLADRIHVYLGDPERAAIYANATFARADELGHPYAQAIAFSSIARMHVLLRDPARALDLAGRALALCAEYGFPDVAHRATIIAGWGKALLGDTAGIADELIPLLADYPRRAGMVAVTSAHLTVVEAVVAAGHLDEALHLVLAAARLVEETGERMEEAEVHRWHGELLLALRGREGRAEARQCFDRALAVSRQQGSRWFELRAAVSLARLDAEQGRARDPRLGALLQGFPAGLEHADLVEARALLASVA